MVAEYGGGGRRGFIIFLEGHDRSCWRSCATKLRKARTFLDFLFGGGGEFLFLTDPMVACWLMVWVALLRSH